MPNKKKETPTEAGAAAVVDRQGKYGHPFDVFTRTAIIWTGILHDKLTAPIEPHEVGLMQAGHKIAREAEMPGLIDDNLNDLSGYADTVAMVYERKRP